MRRDRKLAQKKKARDVARKRSRPSADTGTALMRAARAAPFGPAFMSPEWREEEVPCGLVDVVLTRILPGGRYVAHAALVDRTCLGVKNAMLLGPMTLADLDDVLETMGAAHGGEMERVDVALAQAVVVHSLVYAKALGFGPHPDFEPTLLDPLPDSLVLTPLAREPRPFYTPGPDDDVDDILDALEAAAGPEGFDYLDPDEDIDDADPAEDKPADEARLSDAIQTWFSLLRKEPRLDMQAGFDAYWHAVTGRPPAPDNPLGEEHATSLPVFWGSLFRPLRDGTTGLAVARQSKAMAPHRAELDRLARSRATLFDVLAVGPLAGVARCRDVLDGSLLHVRLAPPMLGSVTRWLRFFGYLTPMDDGTWFHPSTLFGHAWLRNVDLPTTFARLDALLADLGVRERIDPASPASGLLRFAGLFHGLLHRTIAPTPEQAADSTRPIYCVNSDGDRFELHEAVLRPNAKLRAALLTALASADDFVKEGGFSWTREPRATRVVAQERIASVVPQEDGTLKVTANSVPRFRDLLDRIASLAGKRLEPVHLDVMRPWEHLDRAVADETPGCQRLTMGTQALDPGAPIPDLPTVVITSMRRSLDEVVPLLGGRPRDLVKDPAARDRVEQWLAGQELLGFGPNSSPAFLDLDDLRRELGLPPVMEG